MIRRFTAVGNKTRVLINHFIMQIIGRCSTSEKIDALVSRIPGVIGRVIIPVLAIGQIAILIDNIMRLPGPT